MLGDVQNVRTIKLTKEIKIWDMVSKKMESVPAGSEVYIIDFDPRRGQAPMFSHPIRIRWNEGDWYWAEKADLEMGQEGYFPEPTEAGYMEDTIRQAIRGEISIEEGSDKNDFLRDVLAGNLD